MGKRLWILAPATLALAILTPTPAPAQQRPKLLTTEEFLQRLESGELKIESRRKDAEWYTAIRRLEEDYLTTTLLLRNDPERLEGLLQRPQPRAGVLELLPNGDYLLHRRDGDVVLLGETYKWSSVASALANFPSYPNQNRILTEFHRMLSPDFMHQFPLPTSDIGIAELRDSVMSIGQTLVISWVPAPVNPFDPPMVDCNLEVGRANGSDGGNGIQTRPLYLGIDWPLRPFTSCVKNQGKRGTCVSFAITAAVEARYNVLKGGPKQNLSEQALYDAAYRIWGLGNWWSDGLVTPDAVDRATGRAYRFGVEALWPYNPSYSGSKNLIWSTLVLFALERPGSCIGYSSWCSDFFHQAIPVTTVKGNLLGFISPAEAGVGARIQSWLNLDTNPSGQTLAKAYLTLSVPVVLALDVDSQFDDGGSAEQPGVVEWMADTPSMGGHAVLAVGFVDNASLPAGKPAGLGGGYFVIKNSWGTGWGDKGYGYLSYEWVRRHGWGMVPITAVD